MEFAAYFQNTFEVPWMVINAGVRIDAVNYNTKIWSDPESAYTPNEPWYYVDWGYDGIEWIDGNGDGDWLDSNNNPDQYYDSNGALQTEVAPDEGEGDGQYSSGGNGTYDQYDPSTCLLCGDEEFTDENGDAMSAVSNMHTMSGHSNKYQFRTKYETSLVGGALGNTYDDLRGYNDYNIGFGGPVPLIKKIITNPDYNNFFNKWYRPTKSNIVIIVPS
jgi:hypothetical protein